MTIKMNNIVLFIVGLNIKLGFMFKYEKPVAETIWKEPCTQNSMILNDCNWCRCVRSRYTCDARVCREVDMFGHFNDAIRDINVGMEGHGVWRSNQQVCDPGVHYQRGNLLCICTEDGNWPSTICRDTFRILHPVELVEDFKIFKETQCEPAKLYLIGCNVCFCPADSIPNPKFCTTNICSKDDPIFDVPKDSNELSEVYAECKFNTMYKLGCKSCICLKNNKLLCGNCTDTESDKESVGKSAENVCKNKRPGELFNVDCNTCQCDAKGLIYCTVKSCIKNYARSKDDIEATEFEIAEAPLNDINCAAGTKYKKDCNTCYCYKRYGTKKFACSVDSCSISNSIHNGCVEGSTYEKSCLMCQCINYNGKKMEVCQESPRCKKDNEEFKAVTNWVGYCEPLHRFMKGCNPCECLPDGRTARCLSKRCPGEEKAISDKEDKNILKPIAVDIVPIVRDIGHCESGATFRIDCNVCLCLSNNDVICSAEDCRKTS